VTQAAPADVVARHGELVREVAAHAYRYYVLDDPTVSDAEYDVLYGELRRLEAEWPELTHDASPTTRVGGAPRADLQKHERLVRMFSLDNAYSRDDLESFDERVRRGLPGDQAVVYCVEPKLDGASIEVVYELDHARKHAKLALVTTRGDGKIGEIVAENVRTVRSLPLRLTFDAHAPAPPLGVSRITFRGEVVIYRRDLEAINVAREADGLEPFANARNAAAGSLRMLDPREVAKRPLRLALYQFVEGASLQQTHAQSLAWMASLKLPTHRREVLCEGLEAVWKQISALDIARATYPFETDGAVIKVDDYRAHSILGETTKFPRWAIAYKFAPERARTRVLSVEVQVGRTGALTPVANLDPVPLAGTTVSRASLHNFDQVASLDVRVGDLVEIEKAGEIIPQVVAVVLAQRPPHAAPVPVPTRCPECDTEVVRAAGEVALRCPNRRCPAIVRAALHYYARRFAMDIDHLGPSIIEALVQSGLVADVADLYDLTVEQVAGLPRMAHKSASNVVSQIQGSKSRTFDRLLCALGIPQVGQVAAKQLAEVLPSLSECIALGPDGVATRASEVNGFGPSMVEAVRAYFADDELQRLLGKLAARNVSVPFLADNAVVQGPLSGARFCVTGVLSRSREQVHAAIRAAGGEVHDSIKVDTTYLVAGDKVGATKLEAAKKKGTRVIDEATLEAMMRGEILVETTNAAAPARATKKKKSSDEGGTQGA